jgi:hypothetical protein
MEMIYYEYFIQGSSIIIIKVLNSIVSLLDSINVIYTSRYLSINLLNFSKVKIFFVFGFVSLKKEDMYLFVFQDNVK